jgi:hypothetical protein
MSFPEIEVSISSPSELAAVLREVKRCLRDGSLRQVQPASALFAIADLTIVPDDGPWPDYLEAYCRGQQPQAIQAHRRDLPRHRRILERSVNAVCPNVLRA